MLVPDDLEQERAEGPLPHLMSSLFTLPVSAGELQLVFLQLVLLLQAGVVVRPRGPDLLHVIIAEDVVDLQMWVTPKVF